MTVLNKYLLIRDSRDVMVVVGRPTDNFESYSACLSSGREVGERTVQLFIAAKP